MKMHSKVLAALAAGLATTSGLAGAAQAAPKTTVVYSSSSYVTSDLAVSGGTLAFLACGEVFERAEGSHDPLPVPGCSPHVDADGGIAYSTDGGSRAVAQTTHFPVGGVSFWARSTVSLRGATIASADVSAVELADNPDGSSTYGSTSSRSCVREALGADASYRGRVESSLSAVAAGPGRWYTTDREGNTVYRLNGAGTLSVLAVLPPVKVTVTKALATSNGWPGCVVGTTVAFEPTPTEVEVGNDGSVYVAGLPRLRSGKHADRSVIDKINLTSGKIKRLSQRYAGRVDLAVGTKGRLFVARPDTDKISVIKNGRSSTYVKLAKVLAVETDERGRLYAAQGARTGADADVVRIG